VALHAGVLPGYAASHGCIRLPTDFAIRLWGTTKTGARVIVTRDEVEPFEIAHPRLFVRQQKPAEPPADANVPVASNPADKTPLQSGADTAIAPSPATLAVKIAAIATTGETRTASAEAADSTDDATVNVNDVTPDALGLRTTQVATAAADTPRAEPSPAAKPAAVVRTKAEAVPLSVPGAMPRLGDKPLRPGPISVFISRKERKLYVRKGFQPLFETPITIDRPDETLGTHVFTAMEFKDDGVTMRWTAISMPAEPARAPKASKVERRAEAETRPSRKGRQLEVISDATGPAPPVTAAEALDRIEMPKDAVERIAQLLSVGASLIVSDQGIGPETGLETGFIVLTR
jgi:lipoprotein-anchoring transpeptidase ErfK/SrfK